MKRCVIVTAFIDAPINDFVNLHSEDFIICADGGLPIAEKNGFSPDIVIGDFDSMKEPSGSYEVIKYPKEKDDTDTLLCLKYGIFLGYDDFLIIGGLGGRLDHTLANLQSIAFAAKNGCRARIVTYNAETTMILNDSIKIKRKHGHFISLFSYSPICHGVSISGVKYPLNDAELLNSFPIGISNEFCADEVAITVKEGMLLIVMSRFD